MEAIYRLWDALADFPVAQTDDALVFLMQGICQLINAGNAYWLGGLRVNPAAPSDPLKGWRPRANRYLYPSPVHEKAYRDQVARIYRSEANDANHLAVRNVGNFRSFRIRRELSAAWFQGRYYQAYYASRGFHDVCFVIFPVHEDYESYFAFHRVDVNKDFTAGEEKIAACALRGIKWFHRQLILSHGVSFAEGPLSPMQRRIIQLLLTERSEKVIALELGQSRHTTHKHITDIFRKFGVNSRAALMAMWLGQKS